MKNFFFETLIYDRVYGYCYNNGRCYELEQIIATNPRSSSGYAINIIGGRFKFGEKMIADHDAYNTIYQRLLKSL